LARNRGFGAKLGTAAQELIEAPLRRVQIAAPVSFTEHFVQTSVPQTAVHGLIQGFPILGFGIAAIVHTYEPDAGPAPYDLANFSRHRNTSADGWQTSGTRKTAIELFWLKLGM
jgi:hypothetical protein